MSTLKVNAIRGTGASSDAISVNSSDGTCTVKATNNLSNRNLVVNGSCIVAQRSTQSTSQYYTTVDRIYADWTGADEALTQAQVDVTADTDPWNLGFRKAYKLTNGNQTSGAGAGDIVNILYRIENQDVANSGWDYTSTSSYITFSFWVKSSVAQTFYSVLTTHDGTSKAYPFSFALSANTWTKVTKTIPGASDIQFDNDNAQGLDIRLYPFLGTDKTASGVSLDTWANTNWSERTPDMTSTWWTTNDATFEITGLQLEVSEYASEFEHKSYSDELLRCMRYCQVFGGDVNYSSFGVGVWKTSTSASCVLSLMTQMRAAPTLTVANPTDSFIRSGGTNITTTTVALDISSPKSAMYNANASSGGTNGHGATHLGTANTNTTLTLSSEL